MSRVLAVLIALATPAMAQVTPPEDTSLQEKLVPESFAIRASAVASKLNWMWSTTISYSISNNSGMSLYLGIMRGGVSFGACTDAGEARGALQFLPMPHATAFSVNPMQGPPRGVFVPAGGTATGALILANCAAPNPGFATAPLTLTPMVGKTPNFRSMTAFPLAMAAPIRQLQSQ